MLIVFRYTRIFATFNTCYHHKAATNRLRLFIIGGFFISICESVYSRYKIAVCTPVYRL